MQRANYCLSERARQEEISNDLIIAYCSYKHNQKPVFHSRQHKTLTLSFECCLGPGTEFA